MSIMGTMAAGLTVAMLLAGLDVSQYSLAALAGMVLGICFEAGISPWLTLLIVLAVGILGGSFNAFIITVMGVNPIICTMGTSFIFRGIAYLTTDGRYIRIKDDVYYFNRKRKDCRNPILSDNYAHHLCCDLVCTEIYRIWKKRICSRR